MICVGGERNIFAAISKLILRFLNHYMKYIYLLFFLLLSLSRAQAQCGQVRNISVAYNGSRQTSVMTAQWQPPSSGATPIAYEWRWIYGSNTRVTATAMDSG